eukprot:CAMPEP_0197036356 /NCGR_PEP_ID=MMETSP1384-20130603/13890_1 /TAXON_ID=29189 /ORGANISM="Ammonia sp." /LENGTH=252 /DNA_ID=CAMNT_0042466529 /DNA_START=64 /DNA_END=822 /DNA_ORIENTATION=-
MKAISKISRIPLSVSVRALANRRTFAVKAATTENVTFSVFDGGHINIVKSILANDFTARDEPICYHLSRRHFEFWLEPYLRRAIEEKTSILTQVDDIVAGIALNNDFTFKDTEGFLEELKKRDFYGFDLVYEIERDLNRDFRHEMHDKGEFKKGNILRIQLLGVDPHFVHQGLATHLIQHSAARAKELGFKYVTAACSSDHAKHAAMKTGFECLSTMEYDKWEYPKGSGLYPKQGVKELTGFNELSFMVKKL